MTHFGEQNRGLSSNWRSRRWFIRRLFAYYSAAIAANGFYVSTSHATLHDSFDNILEEFENKVDLVDEVRSYREGDFLPAGVGLEKAPISAKPSSTKISEKAQSLIVACEVSSKTAYRQFYQGPVWPKGRSGVTVGVGYDIGYATKKALKNDWTGYVADDLIVRLTPACGKVGKTAHQLILDGTLSDVSIEWEAALDQYAKVMQPRYVGLTERALPNFQNLGLNARGALVSLVYNRGASFDISDASDTTGRYKEMRMIKKLMLEQNFAAIPGEIKKMTRLWDPKILPGLHKRRKAEAALFKMDL
ncbi:hypothetical protein FJ937_04625 [Mesorhizobium sp. B2-4-4]|uniref:pesticin C-terminus-like muramidase n=1 Tax=Mesorhizobium sp. B2-4-4 TaxID=2589945 RepID=UPI00112CDD86|nr:pesticin C-terminus-like muramidase [Mesorhizobium sp. B2-4-4]TPL54929.1 hypothetical protein FJ937_04625 [Mesorhizobium sp. B2-4-4]